MSAKIIKILVMILSDEKLRKKLIILVLSIAFGFIYLLCLPVIVISNLGSVDLDTAGIDVTQFTEGNFMATLDSEQAAQITAMQDAGTAIETKMANLDIADQTIKAQLIYASFFENVENFDANFYANLFKAAPDDASLIDSINQNYGLSIPYEDYLHTYTFVMNNTMNPYMFTDPITKNAEDIAAWASNAYVSGWGYMSGYIGEKDSEQRIRRCDNAGLMIGYLNYDPYSKTFTEEYDTLTYTEQGDITTMPEVSGIGLYDGNKHGIYIGLGEVVFCDETVGYVTKQAVSDGAWTSWCTYEGIIYPQAVQDAIDEINAPDDSSEEAGAMLGQQMAAPPEPPRVENLSASTISVSCIKAEWDCEEGKDYELSVTPTDDITGYTENICIKFEGNSKSYITGLREGSEYEIVVKELDDNDKPIESSASVELCSTESVEVIEEFEYEDGWTNCFAYEHSGGLTLQPSWGAIQGCFPDPVTGTGIMRDEYGDYCCAMGTVYGYCGDRFLITLKNGVQFTTKICDSKGDRAYHPFGGDGKCIVEFIHADGCLPSCVSFTGNYGLFYWDGLIFDNIESIQKINYGEKVEY